MKSRCSFFVGCTEVGWFVCATSPRAPRGWERVARPQAGKDYLPANRIFRIRFCPNLRRATRGVHWRFVGCATTIEISRYRLCDDDESCGEGVCEVWELSSRPQGGDWNPFCLVIGPCQIYQILLHNLQDQLKMIVRHGLSQMTLHCLFLMP